MDMKLEEVLTGWQENWLLRGDFAFATSWRQGRQARFDRLIVRDPVRASSPEGHRGYSACTLAEHIDLINRMQLKKVLCICGDIGFLRDCPSVEDVIVRPAFGSPEDFDYSPLYDLPNLRALSCSTACGAACEDCTTVDYARLPHLKRLHVGGDHGDRGHQGYERLMELEMLSVSGGKRHKSLADLCVSPVLRQLSLLECSVKSLEGLHQHPQLHTLELSHCRALEDISTLREAAGSLRSLVIDSCPRIRDFSALGALTRLEELVLDGSNTLPDLAFLDAMPQLRFLRFTMDVANGDLSPCLRLPYASCRNRRHFSLRDEQLPKRLPAQEDD